MKTLLLVLIFSLGLAYYLVPYETKVILIEKVGIDSTFMKSDKVEVRPKGELVKLLFNKERKDSYKGNLSDGIVIDNKKWASLPYVKCFYEKDYNSFSGSVVLHKIYLPKNKTIEVKFIKDNPAANINMYVYKTSSNNDVYPPSIEYVHECKIDISNDFIKIIEMKGNTAPSDIVIGVAGSGGLLEGGYTLELAEK